MTAPIRKALTFRASSIGDCLMGKYVLENIHMQFPHAHLGLVVGSRGEMIRDLFAAYPWLEIIEANRRSPRALWSLWKEFNGSDLVVTQYAGKPGGRFSLGSKLFARMLAKKGGLIGFHDASRWNGILYDRLLFVHPDRAVAEHDREALRVAGLTVPLPFPTMTYISEGALAKFSLEAKKFIIVHLFAGNKKRGLHPDKKRELLSTLARKFPDTRLVLSGGASDREEALKVSAHISATVIAGEATLQELMELISASRGVVSVDTGVAHLAAQLHIPLTVLRTCVGRNWWPPEQYGNGAPITVLSCDTVCAGGHHAKDYSDCINAVNVENISI